MCLVNMLRPHSIRIRGPVAGGGAKSSITIQRPFNDLAPVGIPAKWTAVLFHPQVTAVEARRSLGNVVCWQLVCFDEGGRGSDNRKECIADLAG